MQSGRGYVENVLRKGLTINVPITFGHTFYFYSDPTSENELKVLNTQQQIIKELALRGDCVMVGRSSGIILEKYNPLRAVCLRRHGMESETLPGEGFCRGTPH